MLESLAEFAICAQALDIPLCRYIDFAVGQKHRVAKQHINTQYSIGKFSDITD